ncbi:unnamed protein product, partial [Ectocarpus fasciculatus]
MAHAARQGHEFSKHHISQRRTTLPTDSKEVTIWCSVLHVAHAAAHTRSKHRRQTALPTKRNAAMAFRPPYDTRSPTSRGREHHRTSHALFQ